MLRLDVRQVGISLRLLLTHILQLSGLLLLNDFREHRIGNGVLMRHCLCSNIHALQAVSSQAFFSSTSLTAFLWLFCMSSIASSWHTSSFPPLRALVGLLLCKMGHVRHCGRSTGSFLESRGFMPGSFILPFSLHKPAEIKRGSQVSLAAVRLDALIVTPSR